MEKFVPAIKVHTHIAGTVSEFNRMREILAKRPQRKKNLRDVVGSSQSPEIGDMVDWRI